MFRCFCSNFNKSIILQNQESWDQIYFQETIIPDCLEFFENPNNIENPKELCLVHDCCPGWGANNTQALLQEELGDSGFIPARDDPNRIDHGTVCLRWAGGNSPDMNVVENLGSILMDKVDEALDRTRGKRTKLKLRRIITKTLNQLSKDIQLLESLVRSFPD